MGIPVRQMVSYKVHKAVERSFVNPKVKEDEERLLALAEKDNNQIPNIVLASVVGLLSTLMMVFMRAPAAVGLSVLATGAVIYWLLRRRKAIEREFEDLIASDPSYWEPIRGRLGRICREAQIGWW